MKSKKALNIPAELRKHFTGIDYFEVFVSHGCLVYRPLNIGSGAVEVVQTTTAPQGATHAMVVANG